jgi:hypothetical protein
VVHLVHAVLEREAERVADARDRAGGGAQEGTGTGTNAGANRRRGTGGEVVAALPEQTDERK